jgi:hypothetical protein
LKFDESLIQGFDPGHGSVWDFFVGSSDLPGFENLEGFSAVFQLFIKNSSL